MVLPEGLKIYKKGVSAKEKKPLQGPGLILMGGRPFVDNAFLWWKQFVTNNDVIILRHKEVNEYYHYPYDDIAACDFIETLVITNRKAADSKYVQSRLSEAGAIFIAGGRQSVFMNRFKGTRTEQGLVAAWNRGAVIGGLSAGMAILSEFIFPGNYGTIDSVSALSDPYDKRITLERGILSVPFLKGVITDTHLTNRIRMGRLIVFMARLINDEWSSHTLGLGVDEGTALVVGPDGKGTVMGLGAIHLISNSGSPNICKKGHHLTYDKLVYHKLSAGDTVLLPSGKTDVPGKRISVREGNLKIL